MRNALSLDIYTFITSYFLLDTPPSLSASPNWCTVQLLRVDHNHCKVLNSLFSNEEEYGCRKYLISFISNKYYALYSLWFFFQMLSIWCTTTPLICPLNLISYFEMEVESEGKVKTWQDRKKKHKWNCIILLLMLFSFFFLTAPFFPPLSIFP